MGEINLLKKFKHLQTYRKLELQYKNLLFLLAIWG